MCAAELAKAGIIEEMMSDSLDSAMDSEDLEEQTEEQVRWAAFLCFWPPVEARGGGGGEGWLGSGGRRAAAQGLREWLALAAEGVARRSWQLGEL